MAKKGMRPEVKRQKMKNNKVGILICSTKDCEEEFYLARFNNLGQSHRLCEPCYRETESKPKSQREKDKALLASLGFV